MARSRTTIFVLWGKQFDEAAAAIFVTQLRRAGIRVKVVGLHGLHVRGANGLELTADISLSDALSMIDSVACVIIPADTNGLRGAMQDPRVEAFLEKVVRCDADVVVSDSALRGWPQAVEKNTLSMSHLVMGYPENQGLIEFAQAFPDRLFAGKTSDTYEHRHKV